MKNKDIVYDETRRGLKMIQRVVRKIRRNRTTQEQLNKGGDENVHNVRVMK